MDSTESCTWIIAVVGTLINGSHPWPGRSKVIQTLNFLILARLIVALISTETIGS